MNLLRIKTEIRDEAARALIRGIDDRASLNKRIGLAAKALTREHLSKIAIEKHGTAQRLGAEPTGHFKEAAESINMAADADGAELRISHRGGLARAVRPVDIAPTGGRSFLTIPVHAAAYGRRVREFERNFGARLFRPYKKGAGKVRAKALAARGADKKLVFFYALRESVHQDQDRELLPSDDQYAIAAKEGVARWIGHVAWLRGIDAGGA
ncbi:MAG TPA: hypothetical protein PLU30_23605 [Verrucomicrobiae bacterium]|nr:hypothetical protein [Verrucomicrobiae bacterium]